MLGGFFRMSGRVDAMSRREVRMMPAALVITLLVMFGGLFMMFGSSLVMLGGEFVMFGAFVLSHAGDLLVRVMTIESDTRSRMGRV
jgi:hypothetical protein